MSEKLNFKSVFSLVVGSQIGSGIFLLPASLALIGPISLFGWVISGAGAILLALVFAQLSMLVTRGGGPHVYVERAFGRKAAFYTAWTYWLVSWVSSIAVIIAAVGYLSPLVGLKDPWMLLATEVFIVVSLTLINMRGTVLAGSLEQFLTLIKCLPLVVIPLAGLCFLKGENFHPINPGGMDLMNCLNMASLMTFWGFVGVETATTSSGIIENPTKTVPRAVILGTLTVAGIYFLNSLGMMGIVPSEVLSKSQAPYVLATEIMFGGGWNLAIGAIAFIACLGTLNAWIMTSGQIAVEAAKDGLFPPLFAQTNRAGAPFMSLLIAMVCTVGLLVLTLTPNILAQLNYIIDISVMIFVFIYLLSVIAFMKIGRNGKKVHLVVAGFAALFCGWVLCFITRESLLICSLFVLSGVPVYLWQQKKVLLSLRKGPTLDKQS